MRDCAPSTYPVYVVFSATQYRTGRLIRRLLGTTYNHVSISFDPSLQCMYSFARRYVNAPLLGGFVKESFRRFLYRKRYASIKVCRLELTEEQYRRLQVHIRMMSQHPDHYIYNLYSAFLNPLKRRVHIKGCYTCVEFVADALAFAGVEGFRVGEFHSLDDMEARCSAQRVVYCGSAEHYPASCRWGEDKFRCRLDKPRILRETAKELADLTTRAFSSISDALHKK
jgi:inositol transport system substrate-binding protein